jgi:hypothetical protein
MTYNSTIIQQFDQHLFSIVCEFVIPPNGGTSKVLSPLKKVVASLVPVAVSLASETNCRSLA